MVNLCVPSTLPSSSNVFAGELQPCMDGTPARLQGKLSNDCSGHDPDLWLYRDRTVGLLKRYGRLSVAVGRLPSLLGREFFRTQVTSYRATSFEDAVIFVHDIARGLTKLNDFESKLIAKIVLQDYTQKEAACLLGCQRRTVGRRFPEALDRLTDIFLEAGLLIRLPETDVARVKNCQELRIQEVPASDSEQIE